MPAVGPQFYFPFPYNQIEAHGIFGKLIKFIQENAEVPTGAFPSSHVGIMFVLLIQLYKYHRILFFIYLPFTILLYFSTVYIKAHYFVDVAAGIVSAIFIFIVVKYFYQKIQNTFYPPLYAYRD